MNYDALYAFVEFSRSLNFTHAAEILSISQPALHVKIKKLSQELGVPLYVKRGRVLELTPHGVELARFGKESEAQTEAFLSSLMQSSRPEQVVLAAGAGSYRYLLGPALSGFGGEKLRLLTTDTPQTLELIRTGEAHMGVTVLESEPADLEALPIHTAQAQLIVPRAHPLARRRRLRLSDLSGLGLIVPPLGRPFRSAVSRILAAHEVPWRVAVEASGWELMMHFASLGLGVTIVNGCCEVPRGLKGIPIQGFPPVRYYLVKKRTFPFSVEQQRLYQRIAQAGQEKAGRLSSSQNE